MPPLHERTFPRSLPRERGRCREAIGMGFAHHCLYLIFTVTSFLRFVNSQKWWAISGLPSIMKLMAISPFIASVACVNTLVERNGLVISNRGSAAGEHSRFHGLVEYKNACSKDSDARAIAVPSSYPIRTRTAAWRGTICSTAHRGAPSARRTPISRVRRVTE